MLYLFLITILSANYEQFSILFRFTKKLHQILFTCLTNTRFVAVFRTSSSPRLVFTSLKPCQIKECKGFQIILIFWGIVRLENNYFAFCFTKRISGGNGTKANQGFYFKQWILLLATFRNFMKRFITCQNKHKVNTKLTEKIMRGYEVGFSSVPQFAFTRKSE